MCFLDNFLFSFENLKLFNFLNLNYFLFRFFLILKINYYYFFND